MQIQCGSTGEHKIRTSIFLLMCFAMAGWFAYDGLLGYPRSNMDWVRQHMNPKPADLKFDARVNRRHLAELVGRMKLDPAVERAARESGASARFWMSGQTIRVDEGVSKAELTAVLGEPAMVHEEHHWFVGPATYARFGIRDDRVRELEIAESPEHTEGDIMGQKWLALALSLVGAVMGVRFLSVVLPATVLDDAGLKVGRHRIAWDEMTGLDAGRYARKGWVELEYRRGGRNRRVRLDSYHIARFNEIIAEICARLNQPSPLAPAAAEQGHQSTDDRSEDHRSPDDGSQSA